MKERTYQEQPKESFRSGVLTDRFKEKYNKRSGFKVPRFYFFKFSKGNGKLYDHDH